jgi:ABC-type lipoprotein export system ATPase subunit
MNPPANEAPVAGGSSAPGPLIRLARLEKSFPQGGGRYYALRDLSLEIRPSEFVSVMGPSGAGKSTLLAVLGLQDSEWSGEYWFDGQPVHSLPPKARAELRNRNMGFVFQSYHLLDELTVFENLEVPLSYRNVPGPRRTAIVCDALDRFHIVAKKDLYPRQLSGGQQQLVAVARALVSSPRLLLADEPTGNLHSDQGREIMELFRQLNAEGVAIVQVTHSEVNAAYGTRVLKLRDGWLEGEETPVARAEAKL